MKTIPVLADLAEVDSMSEIWGMLTVWWSQEHWNTSDFFTMNPWNLEKGGESLGP